MCTSSSTLFSHHHHPSSPIKEGGGVDDDAILASGRERRCGVGGGGKRQQHALTLSEPPKFAFEGFRQTRVSSRRPLSHSASLLPRLFIFLMSSGIIIFHPSLTTSHGGRKLSAISFSSLPCNPIPSKLIAGHFVHPPLTASIIHLPHNCSPISPALP